MSNETTIEALFAAVEKGDATALAHMLAKSDANATNADGRTALVIAARNGHAACVRALLPHCDAKATGEGGDTALMHAAIGGNAACVEALLPASEPNARTHSGKTAMELAILWEHAECADWLAEHSEPREANAALAAFGSAAMPKYSLFLARCEAAAIKQAMETKQKPAATRPTVSESDAQSPQSGRGAPRGTRRL